MKFTDNFSEETKSKAEFLKQIDLNEEKGNMETEALWQTKLDELKDSIKRELVKQIDLSGEQGHLKMELLELIESYMIIVEKRSREKGMKEEEILEEVKMKMPATFYRYQNSIEELKNGIGQLRMLNEIFANKEAIIKGSSR